MPTISLCLIVKNEEKVIERCLQSCVGLIDSVVIIDTGSTDDTQTIIENWCSDNNIDLHMRQEPWFNFGINRTQLVRFASAVGGDWLLLLDADMTVRFTGKPKFGDETSQMLRYAGDLDYVQKLLVKNHLDWRYVGATHEYITSTHDMLNVPSAEITVLHHSDGSSRSEKYERDLKLLQADLKKNPFDARTMFYLARTEEGLGHTELAARHYELRSTMGAWEEEAWFAAFRAATLRKDESGLLGAWERRSWRAEPLYELAAVFRNNNKHNSAMMVANRGLEIPYPRHDDLFIDRGVYSWGLKLELSLAKLNTGNEEKFKKLSTEILKNSPPEHIKALVTKNLTFVK